MNAVNKKARWPLAVSVVCLASTALAQSTSPAITSVRTEGTNLVVTASVPAGVQRLTLETSDRAGRRSWAPRRTTSRGSRRTGRRTSRCRRTTRRAASVGSRDGR